MIAFSESALAKYTFEEISVYGVFDEDGVLVGVKEDAPPDFKEAYEKDKKIRENRQALGLDV